MDNGQTLRMLTAENNDSVQLWHKLLQAVYGLSANEAVNVMEMWGESVLRLDAAVILLKHLQSREHHLL